MADKQTLMQQLGASPKKLALVGILTFVLIAVVYSQLGGSSAVETAGISPSPGKLSHRSPQQTAATTSAAATSGGDEKGEWFIEAIDRRQWKTPELENVVRYDPFALPAAFPQPITAGGSGGTSPAGVVVADAELDDEPKSQSIGEIQAKLKTLQGKGVRVIINGQKQSVAVIGDRTIHVGDEVDGFTVKAIQTDGVVVERKLD